MSPAIVDLPERRNAERIDWIKKLRRGRGLLGKPKDVPLDLFNVSNLPAVYNVVRSVLVLSPHLAELKAIGIALGVGPGLDNTNLTERREVTMESLGVSLRTVMRLEEQGAEILDGYFDMLKNPHSPLRKQVRDTINAAGILEGFMHDKAASDHLRVEEMVSSAIPFSSLLS